MLIFLEESLTLTINSMAQKEHKRKLKDLEGKIGFWRMIRDVLITSMNKGQFPLALCGVIFIVMLVKMPGEDVSRLAFTVIDELVKRALLGYVLAGSFAMGWLIHLKVERRRSMREIHRLANEKNFWQEKILGNDQAGSSE